MGQCISKVNSHSRSRRSRQSTQETTNLSVRPSISDIHQRNIPVVLSHESQIMQRDNNRCIEGNMSTNHYPMEQRNRHAHENSLSNHLRDQEKHISRLVLDTLRKIRTMIDRYLHFNYEQKVSHFNWYLSIILYAVCKFLLNIF